MNSAPPADAGTVLLPLARRAIEAETGRPVPDPDLPAWAADPGAAFVTLHLDGRLRGCIGSLQACRPLRDDVRANARAAAFADPRFRPVTDVEVDRLVIEVSVLGAPEPVPAASESALVAALRPGRDGVVLEAPGHRGTYLPQVWEQLPDPADFIRSLKTKAKLPQDYWSDELRFSRYTVSSWEEL